MPNERLVDTVVVCKVDRLSRSLLDFAQVMEVFNGKGVAFVSVTQNFSTADAIGRLTLNMLMSFAEFEREMIAERTRDKIPATRRKGKWTGGIVPLGYAVQDHRLQEAGWLVQTLLDFNALWDVLTPRNRQLLVRTLVEEVIVDEQAGEVTVSLANLGQRMDEYAGIAV